MTGSAVGTPEQLRDPDYTPPLAKAIPLVAGKGADAMAGLMGGGVIVMFGMVVAAGIPMLSDVDRNKRKMVIFAIAPSVGPGLQLEPGAMQHLPDTLRVLMTGGLLPAAVIAIVLNLFLPEHLPEEATEEVSGGLAGHGTGKLPHD